MSVLINVSDFTGRYNLAKDIPSTQVIQTYIDLYEKAYIYRVLGVDLGDTVIDYIENSLPADPILDKIIDPFAWQDNCGTLYESKGLQGILLGFVYWHYVTESHAQPSITGGIAVQKVETGSLSALSPEATNRYNDSAQWAKAVQYYCLDNLKDYPTFKGQKILLTY
jgi:hypothetical protein